MRGKIIATLLITNALTITWLAYVTYSYRMITDDSMRVVRLADLKLKEANKSLDQCVRVVTKFYKIVEKRHVIECNRQAMYDVYNKRNIKRIIK